MTIRVLVWNEFEHEKINSAVGELYPHGLHAAIAASFENAEDIRVATATLDEPEQGLSVARLEATDVLICWGHRAHDKVDDAVVERVAQRVWEGMGLIVLHSAHFSKIFRRLMGTPCSLKWREAGERERIWVIDRNHPIAAGLPEHFEIEHEEMYGEPFTIPEPSETVLISWFQGGEVFRSGVTFKRGAGRVFYFRPGHETYPTYHHPLVRRVILNAARWAYNPAPPWQSISIAPNVPHDQAPEPVTPRSPAKDSAARS